MSFAIPPEIQAPITQAVGWLWDKYGQPVAEKAAKRVVDETKWKFGIEKYYTSLFERVGFVRILGRMESEPLENVFTHVNVMDKLTAEQRYNIATLKTEFDPRDFARMERMRRVAGDDAVAEFPKLFILGKPGAGKTTFLKHTALRAIKHEIKKVPLFVTLKELSDSGMGIVEFMTHQLSVHRFPEPEAFLVRLLENGDGLVLFDGLDEVNLEDDKRAKMIQLINDFVYRYSDCPTLMTCRVAATDYSFTQFEYVEMADFDAQQMADYIDLWFVGDVVKRGNFKQALLEDDSYEPVRELAQVPLLLALLCLVYEERNEIPPERSEIYEEAMRALLSKWDASRNITRDVVYQQLSLGRKQKMLATIAAQTFERGDYFLKEKEVVWLISNYLQGVPGLEEPDAEQVLKSLEAQHGIFVERARRIHSFSHLTLQEYFAARYIVDNEHRGAVERLMLHVGDDRWNEVFLLVAGMLDDATEFCEKYVTVLSAQLKKDEMLIKLLNSGAQKESTGKVNYKPAAYRAFFHSRVRETVFEIYDFTLEDLYLDNSEEIKLALESKENIDSASDSFDSLVKTFSNLDRPLFLARSLARKLDDSLDMEIDLHNKANALDSIVALDVSNPDINIDIPKLTINLLNIIFMSGFGLDNAIKVAERHQLPKMAEALQALELPHVDDEDDTKIEFTKKLSALLKQYQDQWDPNKFLYIPEKEARHWKDLSKEQIEQWVQYLEANLLLLRCLQVAYVPNRQALEDKILLPPDMW